jgi:hypothetical protein
VHGHLAREKLPISSETSSRYVLEMQPCTAMHAMWAKSVIFMQHCLDAQRVYRPSGARANA